ncbi:IPT/TIG domain-containing protein [Catellatospora bangladeshensis]|nr:IPT/TIG domain-containing protein [Catellatospora bangladeshensis]
MAIPPEAFAAAASLRAAFSARLPADARIGIGAKQTAGEYQDRLAIVVFVPRKLPLEELAQDEAVPPSWREGGHDFETDVVESNPVPMAVLNDNTFYNPVMGGIEVAIEETDGVAVHTRTGTMGCVVQRRSDGSRAGLTCHHVAMPGFDVWQPTTGLGSGATAASVIGKSVTGDPDLDCALIEFNGVRGTDCRVRDVGPVKGSSSSVFVNQPVIKRGRTTGLTTGLVAAVIPNPNVYNVAEIYIVPDPGGFPFCWFGDSGSVVLNVSHEVCGLLFAMDQATTDASGEPIFSTGWARAIQPVLDVLGAEIAVSPPDIVQIAPNTAWGVLANGGYAQVDGWGFDAGSTVLFGGVPAVSVIPASPRRLIVMPPVQFPGQTVDVTVVNSLGEASIPSPAGKFTY